MTGKPEEKTHVGNICRFVHDTRVNGQPMRRSKVKGNVLVFRNPENRTRLTSWRRKIKDCGQAERRELLYSTQDVKG